MKVLQTLGRHGGHQEGIFQYKRSTAGIQIDASVGQANLPQPMVSLSNDEWLSILQTVEQAAQGSFRLTGQPPFNQPPNQSLYQLISQAVTNPAGGWNWHDSLKACVCAILEHEGSIDLYHGALGQGHGAFICLARDIP